MHYALLPAILALLSGCGGGGGDTTACNLAAGAVGGVPGGCLGAGAGGGGAGAVGVGVVTPVALADAASTNEPGHQEDADLEETTKVAEIGDVH